MGKYSNATRLYKPEWENEDAFKGWLTSDPRSNSDRAYCKLCRQDLRPHKKDLLRHKETIKHRQLEKQLKEQPKLNLGPVDVSNEQKKRDIILTLYIAHHSSIRSIDHLGEILNSHFAGESRIHRTKCASIILNVLKPAFEEQLKEEIGDSFFSIILDESTDISQEKMMAYCIRYFNKKMGKIVTDFMGLQVVVRTTAIDLHENFIQFVVEQFGLNLNKMIAIATDGAHNLCGGHQSLFTLLRDDQKYPLPKLKLLKCVCHSLNKCAQYATSELPSNLDYLLRETRNWFCHSPLRIRTYHDLVRSLSGKKPPKLVTLSNTRWLSFGNAVKQNIDQWENLRTHFSNVVKEAQHDRNKNCYIARQLSAMYDDKINYLYLLCANSVLGEVNKINLMFQSNNIDIVHAYNDLYLLIMSCAKRIFKPSFLKITGEKELGSVERKVADLAAIKHALAKSKCEFGNSVLSLNDIDFGYNFEDFLTNTNHGLKSDSILVVKQKCSSFFLKLMEELLERLPSNFDVILKVQYFSPIRCVNRPSKIHYSNLPWELIPTSWCGEKIKSEWDRLQDLRSEDIYGEKMDLSSVDKVLFWKKVGEMENALGEKIFAELSEFAILSLTLPISNAIVERVFSVMNTVKSKLRNKMGTQMLNSILYARLFCQVRNICCKEFEPSPRMYLLHNSNMYSRASTSESSSSSSNVIDDSQAQLLCEAMEIEMEEQYGDYQFITLYTAE